MSLCPQCFVEKDTPGRCSRCGYVVSGGSPGYALPPGTLLHDQYIVGRILGEGGFSVTYLAYDIRLQSRVAIKEFMPWPLQVTRHPEELTLQVPPSRESSFTRGFGEFSKEGQLLALFRGHPHIVTLHHSFEQHGTAYLVMAYEDGATLEALLAAQQEQRPRGMTRRPLLPAAHAVAIAAPILEALLAVADAGYIHGDVKPNNIVLADRGRPVLLDFGTAARIALGSAQAGLVSRGYSPAEFYGTDGPLTAAADVYSIAATLYRMVTGVVPPMASSRRGHEDPLIRPDSLVTGLPLAFTEAVLEGLAPEPADRPTAAEMLQRLREQGRPLSYQQAHDMLQARPRRHALHASGDRTEPAEADATEELHPTDATIDLTVRDSRRVSLGERADTNQPTAAGRSRRGPMALPTLKAASGQRRVVASVVVAAIALLAVLAIRWWPRADSPPPGASPGAPGAPVSGAARIDSLARSAEVHAAAGRYDAASRQYAALSAADDRWRYPEARYFAPYLHAREHGTVPANLSRLLESYLHSGHPTYRAPARTLAERYGASGVAE